MEYNLFNLLGSTVYVRSTGTRGLRLEDSRGAKGHLSKTRKDRWDERKQVRKHTKSATRGGCFN